MNVGVGVDFHPEVTRVWSEPLGLDHGGELDLSRFAGELGFERGGPPSKQDGPFWCLRKTCGMVWGTPQVEDNRKASFLQSRVALPRSNDPEQAGAILA